MYFGLHILNLERRLCWIMKTLKEIVALKSDQFGLQIWRNWYKWSHKSAIYRVRFIKRPGSSRRRFHLGAAVIYLQLQIRDTVDVQCALWKCRCTVHVKWSLSIRIPKEKKLCLPFPFLSLVLAAISWNLPWIKMKSSNISISLQ